MGFSATSIASFARRLGTARAAAYGQTITYRGQPYTACIEPVTIDPQLTGGGQRLDGHWTVRLLRSSLPGPAPARGEQVRYGNRLYVIQTIETDESPAAVEHVFTIAAGSAV